MTIDKITNAPSVNEHIAKTNEIIDVVNQGGGGGGGTATDVQINGTTITANNVANIRTNGTYNASSNKIATMSDVFSRNIGEIVQSTIPLTDAGLHLLDGSLIYGNGIYADFVDYIASIYNASANYFCSESDWQTTVTTYGVCGKFVYDSTNNTVRLPLVTGFTESTISATTLGDLTEAGLPNITGTFYLAGGKEYSLASASGAFTKNKKTGVWGQGGGEGGTGASISINASRSSSIYGNSETVQPQSVKVLYYIVVANSTKTDIEVDIDEVVTDLNNRTNRYNFDSQFVTIQPVAISTSTAVGSYTLDVSDILPNDNYSYYLICTVALNTANDTRIYVGTVSSPSTNNSWYGYLRCTSNSRNSTCGFIIPVGADRKIYSQITNAAASSSAAVYVSGYRRIGTNN
jgi:hypothetical protein